MRVRSVLCVLFALAMAAMSSGCCSIAANLWCQQVETQRRALRAVVLRDGNGAGAAVDLASIGALEAAKAHPGMTLGALVADLALGYAAADYYRRSEREADRSDEEKGGSGVTIINNGNGNETTVIAGDDNDGNEQPNGQNDDSNTEGE